MDSMPVADRCGRFIREFGADYVRKFGFGIGARLVVVAEQLALDERDGCVRHQVVVRPEGSEEEVRFLLDPVFFAPTDATHDQVRQVAEDLGSDAGVVRRRFRTAGLAGRKGR